jgi:tRNA(Ile)-lysidine synthase
VISRVKRTIQARGLFRRGDRVLCACSGGPDSLALLHALRELAPTLGISLRAVYVDHGLRPEAAAEGERVVREAAKLGLNGEVVRITLRKKSMEAAREARYEALSRVARERGATKIAVAHTLSDQAETVLMRLLRGSGPRGLAGIPPRRGLIVRPLIDVTRAEVEAYCRQRKLRPVRDPTNRRDDYLRNRIRKIVMPALQRENPRLEQALGRLGDNLRELDATIEEAATGAHTKDVAALRELPAPVRARTLERAHHDALTALLGSARGTGEVSLPGNLVARRRYDQFEIVSAATQIDAPGRYRFGDVDVEVALGEQALSKLAFDAAQTPLPWLLRAPRPGDRLRVRGLGGTKKLQDLFVDGKVPRERRSRTPVLERNGEILCVGDLRASEFGRPTAATTRFLSVLVLTPSEGV